MIPSTIGNVSNLSFLLLYSNKLKGEIPSSICNLTPLQILHLSNNSLEGPIPQCLGNLSNSLKIFHLNKNYITGLIPSTFTSGCSLQSLNLNGNRLEGALPQTLVHCKSLRGFDIGNNAIQDIFPFWMETLSELRVLVLRSNRFNGTMLSAPTTRHPFPKLQGLDASHNAFVGSLPYRYFKNFRAMMVVNKENETEMKEDLYLSYVQLNFTLKGLDQLLERLLTAFTTIDLSSNRFSGSIPCFIGDLNHLVYLNLSYNSLTGHLPTSLGNITTLESLDLSSNKLDGEIPWQLILLKFLSTLNLSVNNLVGKIPQSFQFSTFENDSYMGNSGLCGFPLTKTCEEKPSSSMLPQEGVLEGFGWQAIVSGYGCGFIVGIIVGYFTRHCERPKWIMEFELGVQYKKKRYERRIVAQRIRN
ncbi:hypothetical protein C2S51_014444 [Perilla frutescens var. frutescens]|nr:hypothetical protein C2S51_014444 [Perilla frutescens var. frutescens]